MRLPEPSRARLAPVVKTGSTRCLNTHCANYCYRYTWQHAAWDTHSGTSASMPNIRLAAAGLCNDCAIPIWPHLASSSHASVMRDQESPSPTRTPTIQHRSASLWFPPLPSPGAPGQRKTPTQCQDSSGHCQTALPVRAPQKQSYTATPSPSKPRAAVPAPSALRTDPL